MSQPAICKLIFVAKLFCLVSVRKMCNDKKISFLFSFLLVVCAPCSSSLPNCLVSVGCSLSGHVFYVCLCLSNPVCSAVPTAHPFPQRRRPTAQPPFIHFGSLSKLWSGADFGKLSLFSRNRIRHKRTPSTEPLALLACLWLSSDCVCVAACACVAKVRLSATPRR